MINYNRVNISINSQYIMCNSASLSQNAQKTPLYVLNNSIPANHFPGTVKNTLSINYDIETENEPNYKLVSGWKNNTTGNLMAVINFGNVLMTGYLTSYSFNISPTRSLSAEATYSIFREVPSGIGEQSVADSGLYNLLNSTGRSAYHNVSLLSNTSDIVSNQIIELNYNFNANMNPKYKLGSPFPTNISVTSCDERLDVLAETQSNITYNNTGFYSLFQNINYLTIENMAGSDTGVMVFNISGFIKETEQFEVSLNSPVLFNSKFIKYY